MSRILILGATGMLGHKLCQQLPGLGHDVAGSVRSDPKPLRKHEAVFSRTRLIGGVDAHDPVALERVVKKSSAEVVVNCIGVIKQLRSAQDRYLSVELNSALPHRLARICKSAGVRLIHLSTDCVFDGTQGNYRESDPSDARDLYGKSKYLGETDEAEDAAVTLRTSMIGRELRRPTHGLVEWLLSQNGRTVRGFSKAVFSGFTTHEMARLIGTVAAKGCSLRGTVHAAAAPITKYDLLGKIRDAYGLDVTVQRYVEFVCDRSLMVDQLSEATGYTPPSWDTMIREMAADPTPYDALQQAVIP